MEDLENIEEVLAMLKAQEEMVLILENQQIEVENLQTANQSLKEQLDESMSLNETQNLQIMKLKKQIDELQKCKSLIGRKEDDIGERIRKLKSRRATDSFGGDAGLDRKLAGENRFFDKSGTGELQVATADIETFLRKLDIKERAAGEDRENC